MPAKTFPLKQLVILLALFSVCAMGQTEVYKWVDEHGRTHYSEKPENAGNTRAQAVKTHTPTGPRQSPEKSAAYWGEQERLRKQRQIAAENRERYAPQANTRPKSLSGGRSDPSDQSKCNLARDVLNGSVVHSNGKPTDDYDRRVARRDLEKYCH